jgi:RNA polymerase sigma factor (sigma-70 family)
MLTDAQRAQKGQPMSFSRPTDGECLARFVRDGDADAFALLVGRHGSMVHRQCARLCRGASDAEDAAQHVFITLADKAPTLVARTSLAGWLHRTACHTALRWRRSAANRRAHERRAAEMLADRVEGEAGSAAAAGASDEETIDQLHRALGALPEDYRNAMILHHLEGHTIEQVAELLATRPGTVAARLSRGRSMLRDRLTVIAGASAAPLAVEEWLTRERAIDLPPDVAAALGRPPRAPTGPTAACESGAVFTAAAATTTAPLTFVAHMKAATILIALSAGAFGASAAAGYRFVTAPATPPPVVIAAEPEPDPIPVRDAAAHGSVPEPSGILWLAPFVALTRRRRSRGLRA